MTNEFSLRPLAVAAVNHVAANMRAMDREEIFATQFGDDPMSITAACMAVPQFAWTAWREDEPIAVVGAVPMHPSVWSVYAFATDRFSEIAYPLTRFVKRGMIPSLASSGCRRAQCLSLASHKEAHDWLTYLGAEATGQDAYRRYGRHGEDFILFVWRQNPHVLNA